MNRDLARIILLEQSRRDTRPVPEKLGDLTFPQQDAFVHDPADFVAALCSRRAGKSTGFGKRAIRAMYRHPGFTVPYIGLTRESSYNIMWPILWQLNRQYNLGAKLHESDLRMELRNGSNYKLFGADMKNFIERLRGGKYSEAHIDEAQSFRSHLKTLIDDVLGPALGDLRGPLALGGTPGPIPDGIFFKASKGKLGFSAHHWTVFENPYFPKPREFVAKLKLEKGWTDNNPTYQREWLGQWVLDDDALVYKFRPDRNIYDELPVGLQWSHILAIDYGWNDQTAFAIVAFSKQSPHVFIRHVEGHSEMVPSDIAKRAKELIDEFKPINIVADTGGLGKSITEEFIRRYHIPISAADKREKLTFINLLNGDFIDGRCFVHRSLTNVHDQYQSLQKAENPTASRYEDPTMRNDLADAILYAYRKARHYLGQTPHTYANDEEKWKAYEKDLEQKEIEAIEGEGDRAWWEK
jgi:terminase large subunit-like protein